MAAIKRFAWIPRYMDFVLIPLFAAAVISRRDFGVRFLIGMAIAVFGIALWLTARIQLGSAFAVTAQAKRLVTKGVYSKVRNPIYFFGGIGYFGLFIAWGNWVALGAFFLVYLSYQVARVRREQRVLEDAFGDEYRKYRARTWF